MTEDTLIRSAFTVNSAWNWVMRTGCKSVLRLRAFWL